MLAQGLTGGLELSIRTHHQSKPFLRSWSIFLFSIRRNCAYNLSVVTIGQEQESITTGGELEHECQSAC